MAASIRGSSFRSSMRSVPGTPRPIGEDNTVGFVVSPPRSPRIIRSPTSVSIGSHLGPPVVEPGQVLVETVTVEADPGVSTTCCLVTWRTVVLLLFCLSVPMLTIGIIYAKDCPHFPFCPIYLIIGGCIGILQFMYAAQDCVYYNTTSSKKGAMSDLRYKIAAFFFLLFIAWTFFGSIPFFAVKGVQWLDKSSSHYCDNMLYHFTLYLSAIMDVMYFAVFFGALFSFVLYAPTKREHEKRLAASAASASSAT